MEKRFVSFDEIIEKMEMIANIIEGHRENSEYVLFSIERGGNVPATILSHLLDVCTFRIQKCIGDVPNLDKIHLKQNQIPVIVDDIVDTGITMRHAISAIFDNFSVKNCLVATPFAKRNGIQNCLDDRVVLYHAETIPEDSPWLVFPWERDRVQKK